MSSAATTCNCRHELPHATPELTSLRDKRELTAAVTPLPGHSDEFGVRYDIHAKDLDEVAETEGLHMGPPGFEYIKYKSTFSTVLIPEDVPNLDEFSCVSADGASARSKPCGDVAQGVGYSDGTSCESNVRSFGWEIAHEAVSRPRV